jgi:hypothetical protein
MGREEPGDSPLIINEWGGAWVVPGPGKGSLSPWARAWLIWNAILSHVFSESQTLPNYSLPHPYFNTSPKWEVGMLEFRKYWSTGQCPSPSHAMNGCGDLSTTYLSSLIFGHSLSPAHSQPSPEGTVLWPEFLCIDGSQPRINSLYLPSWALSFQLSKIKFHLSQQTDQSETLAHFKSLTSTLLSLDLIVCLSQYL